ncbi:MAG: recombinase family protein [Armatimonadia bacterium]
MRCAIYIRVSTEEQARDGLSLDMQRHRCEQAAFAAGAASIEHFCDDGYSGTRSDNRPALQGFLSRLSEFDVLYVWKLDRLARSARDWHNIMHVLAAADVGFVSISEAIDAHGIVGKATLGILANVAELFVDILRENVKAALAERTQRGLTLGPVPFGYQRGAKGDPILPDPHTAPILLELYQRYAEGETIAGLAKWLTIATKRSTPWAPTVVRKMLTNPVYAGRIVHNGEVLEGLHVAIVPDDVWRAAQARCRESQRVHPPARQRSLAPVYRCGFCGAAVMRHTGNQACYGCSVRQYAPPADRHAPLWVPIVKVEHYTWEVVRWLTSDEAADIAHRRQQVQATGKHKGGRTVLLTAERDEMISAIAYNLEAARLGAVPVTILIDQNRPLQARLGQIDTELARLVYDEPDPVPHLSQGELLALVQSASAEEQRLFLRSVFDRVELFPDRMRFILRSAGLPPLVAELPRYYAPGRGVSPPLALHADPPT